MNMELSNAEWKAELTSAVDVAVCCISISDSVTWSFFFFYIGSSSRETRFLLLYKKKEHKLQIK